MRPWLKNKQQQNTQVQEKNQVKILKDIIDQIDEERNINLKSRSSIRGEFIYDKIKQAQQTIINLKESDTQYETISDHFSAYIAYLINLYVNMKGDLLDSKFIQNLMLSKTKINWKSNKFFTIVDESNAFLIFENKVGAEEKNITFINKNNEKCLKLKLDNSINNADNKTEKENEDEQEIIIKMSNNINGDFEIHRFIQKCLTMNDCIYNKYEGFEIKSQQKYYIAVLPFETINEIKSTQLQYLNSIQNFLYHIYLYKQYPNNISPILDQVSILDEQTKYQRLVFFIQKPQCTLQDMIKERNNKKQPFSQNQLRRIFQSLIELILNMKEKQNICINDLTTENIGYYKNNDNYCIISLDLLSKNENELIGKVHLLNQQYYDNYQSNETNKFNHFKNSLYQLAITLLQVYHLKESIYQPNEIINIIQQLEESDKNNNNDLFFKVILSLFKYDVEDIKKQLNQLIISKDIEEIEDNKNEINDLEISKKVIEKLKKKKKPNTLQETLQIASGYYEIQQNEKSVNAYKEFIQKSEEGQDDNNNNNKDQVKNNKQKDVIFALKEISLIYLSLDNINESLNYIRQAAQISQQFQLLNELKLLSFDWNELGKNLQEKGLLSEQLKLHQEILRMLEQNLNNKNDESIAFTLKKLAEAQKNVGDYDSANKSIKRAYEIDEQLYGNNTLQIAISMHELGTMQLLKGMFNQAIDIFNKSIEIKKEKLSQDDPEIARGLNNLAEAYRGLGNNKKALELFEKALNIFNKANLKDTQEVAPILNNIGIILYQQGEFDKGIDFLDQALKIEQKIFGENHPNNAQTMFNMMIMLQKINKIEEAVQYGSQAFRIFLNMYPQGHPTLLQCQQVLNFLSSKLKQPQQEQQ